MRVMLKVARRSKGPRYTYPPCPECGAVGAKGFARTRLGNLRCKSCNSMFTFEYDKKYNVKLGKNLGD